MTLYLNGTSGISGVDGSAGTPAVQGTDANTGISFPAADTVAVNSGGSERLRTDSSGRLLVGTSSARSNIDSPWGNFTPSVQFETTNNGVNGLSIIANATDGYPGEIILGCSRGSSAGSNTAVQSGQRVGQISFQGADGTNLIEAAEIKCEIDATPGTNDMPGRLVFSTTADGASSPTERMRIDSNGRCWFNTTVGAENETKSWFIINGNATNQGFSAYGYQDAAGNINRSNDGTLLNFRSAAVTQGTISVSGSTVSYNGAHLSRWSQLPSGQERTEILRGTVLSNIDEMCEWGEEDNEQLNRMKVSNVEGDKNVSGVFQAWDDDDDTYENDFYCAMTGDFIIRVAEGVTVERGDLLMSAGDGTAKPQDDDIIRSKTIAKVTSTNVSCTYEDGSYCVPCVLMAC